MPQLSPSPTDHRQAPPTGTRISTLIRVAPSEYRTLASCFSSTVRHCYRRRADEGECRNPSSHPVKQAPSKKIFPTIGITFESGIGYRPRGHEASWIGINI